MELVKSVLAAVDVPLIVTGHNHYDKINEVLKAVAQACAGENLLLNWVGDRQLSHHRRRGAGVRAQRRRPNPH